MNWIILIVAGFCEVGFTYCLGRAKAVEGLAWWGWICGFLMFTIISLVNCVTEEVVVSRWLEELPHTIDMAGAVTKTAWDGNTFNVTLYKKSPSWIETVELPEEQS